MSSKTDDKPLIAIALRDEASHYFDDENVVFTGCGKINAAYYLTKAIAARRPRRVINLGSAGSAVFSTGSLVNCVRFIQHDMDVSPLGFVKGQTPFDTIGAMLEYGETVDGLPQGVCGTGDCFVTKGSVKDCDVIDMEAYALARVCLFEQIPFVCVKYITDGADGQAAQDWGAALAEAARRLYQLYRNTLLDA